MKRSRHSLRRESRSAFTLVEMLVSTALVLLIMVLFAQIYGAAVGTLREQEGISKNDQKARSVISMMRADLGARSYREIPAGDPTKPDLYARGIVPIHPRCLVIDDAQKGFFYYSENNPGDDTDDVLSFTMFLNTEIGQFAGRVTADGTNLANHPDSDDGVQNDGMTASRAAVVTYFLREGRLCRRIHLLREPLVIPSPWSTSTGALFWLPTQPSDETVLTSLGTGNPIAALGTQVNWYDTNAIAIQENAPGMRVRVLGADSLDNWQGLTNGPIAIPRNRQGHNAAGLPTGEYTGTTFQGRAELTGVREGEDVILANVVGFDVQVWEPQDANVNSSTQAFEGSVRGGRFANLGHGVLTDGGMNVRGPFGSAAATAGNSTWGKINTAYVAPEPSMPSQSFIFDTWHPLAPNGTIPGAPPAVVPSPPYYPLKIDPTASASVWTTWTANQTRTTNTTDWTQSAIYFPWAYLGDYSIGYRAANPGGTGTTGAREPVWSRIAGNKVLDGTTAGGVVWECFDNRIGLTGLRITVRFVDPGSTLVRQVTLDHSFLD
jgi:type II secretory pathway pseudopilin PulG